MNTRTKALRALETATLADCLGYSTGFTSIVIAGLKTITILGKDFREEMTPRFYESTDIFLLFGLGIALMYIVTICRHVRALRGS